MSALRSQNTELTISSSELSKLAIEVSVQAIELFRSCSGMSIEEVAYQSWLLSRSEEIRAPKWSLTSEYLERYKFKEHTMPVGAYITLLEIYAYDICRDNSRVQCGLTFFMNFIINSVQGNDPSGTTTRKLIKMHLGFQYLLPRIHQMDRASIGQMLLGTLGNDVDNDSDAAEVDLLNAAGN